MGNRKLWNSQSRASCPTADKKVDTIRWRQRKTLSLQGNISRINQASSNLPNRGFKKNPLDQNRGTGLRSGSEKLKRSFQPEPYALLRVEVTMQLEKSPSCAVNFLMQQVVGPDLLPCFFNKILHGLKNTPPLRKGSLQKRGFYWCLLTAPT